MGYAIGNRVRVSLDGHAFTAHVAGIQGAAVIIRPEVWESWMDVFKDALDPEGCIVVHGSCIQEVLIS